MVKRFVAALVIALPAAPAAAQVRPSDVPVPSGFPITYKTDGTLNILGDGSSTSGTPPVEAIQLPDIPTTPSLFAANTNTGGGSMPCDANIQPECKFRTVANISHNAYDDPIRNFGQPGASHLHTFFGATTGNAFSTYASLRNNCNAAGARGKIGSTAAGSYINCSLYWHPAIESLNPFGDGKNYIVQPYYYVVYYARDFADVSTQKMKRIPRGRRYVFGVNMDDPDNCAVKNRLSLANGGSGTGCVAPTTGRYRMLQSSGTQYGLGSLANGFGGWTCYQGDGTTTGVGKNTTTGSVFSPFLKNADGSDPWEGQGCDGPGSMRFVITGPECDLGRDLWVPGGYDTLVWKVDDTLANKHVCPHQSYEGPSLQVIGWVRFEGKADRLRWRLSSDDMAALVSGHAIPNGGSMHTDWFGAWDDTALTDWLHDCLGVGNTSPFVCDGSRFRVLPSPLAMDISNVSADWTKFSTSSPAGMKLIPANKGVGPATLNATPKP